MQHLSKLLKQHKVHIFYGLLIFFSVICFAEITDDVIYDPREGDFETPQFDNGVLTFLKSLHRPSLIQSMTDFTALGSVSVLTLFVIVISIVLIYLKEKRLFLYLMTISTGAVLLPTILKHTFNRTRPSAFEHLVNVSSSSYPSGHALASTTLFLSFAFIAAKKAKSRINEMLFYAGALTVIFLVSFSRMYLGVHYPTDVFAGISLGVAWYALVSALFFYETKNSVSNFNGRIGEI